MIHMWLVVSHMWIAMSHTWIAASQTKFFFYSARFDVPGERLYGPKLPLPKTIPINLRQNYSLIG